MADTKHGMGHGHGEVTYSVTGESNAGDSRPSSARPDYHYNGGSVIDIYKKPGSGHAAHG